MWLYYTSFECAFLTLCFFANNLLFAVYFIFILDKGNDIRQKANSSDVLIWVKRGDNQQHQQCVWPRNCSWMYSEVVVREVLQGRQEPCR